MAMFIKRPAYILHSSIYLFVLIFLAIYFKAFAFVILPVLILFSLLYLLGYYRSTTDNAFYKISFAFNYLCICTLLFAFYAEVTTTDSFSRGGALFLEMFVWGTLNVISILIFFIGFFRNANSGAAKAFVWSYIGAIIVCIPLVMFLLHTGLIISSLFAIPCGLLFAVPYTLSKKTSCPQLSNT